MVALENWDKPSKIWTNLRRIGVYAGITVCSLFVFAFLINFIKSFICMPHAGSWIKRLENGTTPCFIYTWPRTIFAYITGALGTAGLILLPGHL
jgi:hypothetical protein